MSAPTTIPPAPPAPTERPNRDLVSSWHLGSMERYLDLTARHRVAEYAVRADQLIAEGADHKAVMQALGAAEYLAPADERHLHIARTDAYAELHRLRGWYRYTTERGEHAVSADAVRTPDQGDVGRYYVMSPFMWGPYLVKDRDTGTVMTQVPERAPADEWIARAEGTWGSEPVAVQPAPASNLHWSERSIETVDVLAGVAA
ncbi:hypothetical protein ACFP2T_16325 [Plantactinospora solaniradicis]|uniref:Uncharacterized protein n=1 Tax=Plantactinospora solaniradicis TaxID=1723736 RepID=A0ABW1KBS5_9ACTN